MTSIENLLGRGFEFVSDPTQSKFPIPVAPSDHPEGELYITSAFPVTAEMARDWLKHRVLRVDLVPADLRDEDMVTNRSIGATHARRWRDRFLGVGGEGTQITHQGIGFSKDGYLLDGQHRLAGRAMAGDDGVKEWRPPVAINIPHRAFSVMDIPRNRTAGQMIDRPNSPTVSSIIRYLLPAINETHQEVARESTQIKHAVAIAHSWTYFAPGNPWVTGAMATRTKSVIPPGILGAVCIAAHMGGLEASRVFNFMEGLRNDYMHGYPPKGNGSDPRYLLKVAFSQQGGRKTLWDTQGRLKDHDLAVSLVRRAMTVWAHWENDQSSRIELTAIRGPQPNEKLPPLFGAQEVRDYYLKHTVPYMKQAPQGLEKELEELEGAKLPLAGLEK